MHLGDAVREAAAPYQRRFRAKGIDFRVELSVLADRPVHGDGAAIRRILDALISNALRFTTTGQVSLFVAPGDGEADYRLSVIDTGVGLEGADLERIFGGTGSGLAVGRCLAVGMGGTLEAAPRPSGGAVFTLTLPLPDVGPALAGETPRSGASEPERRLRVLVVDDHPLNRKLAEAMLIQVGAEVFTAEDGEQACRTFRAGRFDLVLMDIQMPVMDGLAATRAIRAIEAELHQRRTPILMLTANTLPEHVEASREAGADRHLAKPIQLGALVEAVNAALTFPRAA